MSASALDWLGVDIRLREPSASPMARIVGELREFTAATVPPRYGISLPVPDASRSS